MYWPLKQSRARTRSGHLYNAVEMEQASKVRVLLGARGINPNLRDANETPGTALDLALRDKSVEIATVLIVSPKVRASPAQRALLKRMRKVVPEPEKSDSNEMLPFPGIMTGSNDN